MLALFPVLLVAVFLWLAFSTHRRGDARSARLFAVLGIAFALASLVITLLRAYNVARDHTRLAPVERAERRP